MKAKASRHLTRFDAPWGIRTFLRGAENWEFLLGTALVCGLETVVWAMIAHAAHDALWLVIVDLFWPTFWGWMAGRCYAEDKVHWAIMRSIERDPRYYADGLYRDLED